MNLTAKMMKSRVKITLDEVVNHAFLDRYSEFDYHVWLDAYGVDDPDVLPPSDYSQAYDAYQEEMQEYYRTLPQYQLAAVKQFIKQNDIDNHKFDRIYDLCFPLGDVE